MDTHSSRATLSPNSQVQKIIVTQDKAQYVIEKYERTPWELPFDSYLTLFLHILTWSMWSFYLFNRITFILSAQAASHTILPHEWIILAIEGIFLFSEALSAFELTLSLLPPQSNTEVSKYVLVGDEAPTIDVMITTCGEDVSVVMNTALSAAHQTYPLNAFRIFILDDANNTKLEDEIEKFNSERGGRDGVQTLTYLSREKNPGVHHFYKSGNLRHGLETSQKLGNGSEYFASLDADMVVEPRWLRTTIPHLIMRPEVGLANIPPLLYNVPDGDALGQDTNVFPRLIDPIRNRFGCVQCSGSGYIMRRKALDSIGGWPLHDLGEDIVCSWLLINKGWKSVFVQDEMQFGLIPECLDGYLTQRKRWTDGTLLLGRQIGLYTPGFSKTTGATVAQQLFGFTHVMKTLMSVPNICAMFLLPICLYLDGHSIAPHHHLQSGPPLQKIFLCTWVYTKLTNYQIYDHVGMQNLWNLDNQRLWTTPQFAERVIASLLPNTKMDFKVTGAFQSIANERSATRRQPLPWRMLSPVVMAYTAYTVMTASVILYIIFNSITEAQSFTDHGINHIGATVRLFACMFSASVPVRYMLNPPTVPERSEMVAPDENNVQLPKRKGWLKRDNSALTIEGLVKLSVKDLLELTIIVILGWL